MIPRFLEKYAYKADTGESFDRFKGILTVEGGEHVTASGY